jgi:hypothetical protein
MMSKNEIRLGELVTIVAILIVVIGVYFPVLHYPYLLADANWMVRGADPVFVGEGIHAVFGHEQGYPSLSYVALTQGRPVFAGIIYLIRLVAEDATSLEKMQIVNTASVAMMSAWAVLLFSWLREAIARAGIRFLIVIALTVSPAFAMYVYGGPWLAPGLLLVIASAFSLRAVIQGGAFALRSPWFYVAVFLLLCGWALYQATPLILVGLFVLTWISWGGRNKSAPRAPDSGSVEASIGCDRRSFWIVVSAQVLSLVIYVTIWAACLRGMGTHDQNRYSLSSIVFENFDRTLGYFFSDRLPQAMNLWTVDSIEPSLFFWLVLLFLARFFVCLPAVRQGFEKGKISVLLDVILLWVLMLMVSDFPALMGSEPDSRGIPILSYMTLAPLALLVMAAAFRGAVPDIWLTTAYAESENSTFTKLVRIAVFVLLLAALIQAGYRGSRQFAVPLHKEYSAIQAAVMKSSCDLKEPLLIALRVKQRHNVRYKEYGWRSAELPFYAFWLSRNVLDDLGLHQLLTLSVRRDGHELVTIEQSPGDLSGVCRVEVTL